MTAESMAWSIERVWQAITVDKTEHFTTAELSRFRCVVMLGSAGAGKTTEAARLAHHEQASGLSVRECRLAEFADTSVELTGRLAALSAGANEKTAFYLDALDEAMIPARRRWLAIKHWVTDTLQGTGASIRITCRSAVWPSDLTHVICEFAGEQSFATVFLQPLSDDDIAAAAASSRIDPVAFLDRVEGSRARSLAGQPLTLRMLIALYQSECGLPATLKDLFEAGLEKLVSDAQERWELGTQIPLSPAEILDAAEFLACYTMLTGRETVHLRDEPSPYQLSYQELSGRFTTEKLRAIGSSGIFDSTSPASFRFGHRQFAEYLAGRRLARLPGHQARTFLASPDGSRTGAAGPLRETAAFAAMFSADLAQWLAGRDPDVIGLSDVADSNLRREATLALLDRFRRKEMTDAQLRHGDIELRGFQYDGAEADLREVLKERCDGCEDVLECAIKLAASWKLLSVSDDLAALVLDSTAPLQTRIAAGYALCKCGTDPARARLKPLVTGLPEDESDELKGIAFDCNWPDRLSTPELLTALTARRSPSFFGAYESFLAKLDKEEFAAAGHRAMALRWAKTRVSELGDVDVLHRIAMRIARAALQELHDPVVARELTGLLRHWAQHHTSPLASLRMDWMKPQSEAELDKKASLWATPDARRQLIDRLVEVVEDPKELPTLAYRTPGLLNAEDFLWLLDRGCDEQRQMVARQNYLHVARFLPWWNRSEHVDAWLRVCDEEPVKAILGNQKSVELNSEEATQLRERWKVTNDNPPRKEVGTLDPPPRDRVLRALGLAETNDIRYFRNVCRELTLEPASIHFGSERFLTKTPGWLEADADTRNRIVEAAKAYLSVDGIASEASAGVSPHSFHVDVLGAMWLILERDQDWLISRARSWWKTWCWYILRELMPTLLGESTEPKRRLLRLLNEATPAMCQEIVGLAAGEDDAFDDLLLGLLRLLVDEPNRELDEGLCEVLRRGRSAERNTTEVAKFVLARAPGESISVCVDILNGVVEGMGEAQAEHVAVALLRQQPRESWDAVKAFVCAEEERGRRVLERFAHDGTSTSLDSVSTEQLGHLTEILIELFPPETDLHSEGVSDVTPDDSARRLRDRLISSLGSRQLFLECDDCLRPLQLPLQPAVLGLELFHPRVDGAWRRAPAAPVHGLQGARLALRRQFVKSAIGRTPTRSQYCGSLSSALAPAIRGSGGRDPGPSGPFGCHAGHRFQLMSSTALFAGTRGD